MSAGIHSAGLVVVVVLLAGCGTISKAEVIRGLEGARDFQNFAAPIIGERQKAEEAACGGDAACLSSVAERYEVGAALPMKAFLTFWCGVVPDAEGC